MKFFNTLFCLFLFVGTICSQTVIIDLGAGTLRAGLSTAAAPTVTINSTFAHEGTITDWNGFKTTLTDVFSQLGVTSSNCSVLFGRQNMTSKDDLEQIATILFVEFTIQKLYMLDSALGALYSKGLTTGVVANIQEDITVVTSVYQGMVLAHNFLLVGISGEEIRNDNEVLYVGTSNGPGVSRTIYDAIVGCDVDMRPEMSANIIIAGDQSNVAGIESRMKSEVTHLAPSGWPVNVTTSNDAGIMAWKGGKMMVDILSDEVYWFTKTEFNSKGVSAMHLKFY